MSHTPFAFDAYVIDKQEEAELEAAMRQARACSIPLEAIFKLFEKEPEND